MDQNGSTAPPSLLDVFKKPWKIPRLTSDHEMWRAYRAWNAGHFCRLELFSHIHRNADILIWIFKIRQKCSKPSLGWAVTRQEGFIQSTWKLVKIISSFFVFNPSSQSEALCFRFFLMLKHFIVIQISLLGKRFSLWASVCLEGRRDGAVTSGLGCFRLSLLQSPWIVLDFFKLWRKVRPKTEPNTGSCRASSVWGIEIRPVWTLTRFTSRLESTPVVQHALPVRSQRDHSWKPTNQHSASFRLWIVCSSQLLSIWVKSGFLKTSFLFLSEAESRTWNLLLKVFVCFSFRRCVSLWALNSVPVKKNKKPSDSQNENCVFYWSIFMSYTPDVFVYVFRGT